MPEIKVILDPKTHQKLKEYAKENGRSLTNYIERLLTYSANSPSNPLKDTFIFTPITLAQTQTDNNFNNNLNLEQLQEQGVTQIKFNNKLNQKTPEQQELQELKMQRQFDTLKEQRIRFLKQKAKEILDFTLPYLENNDQKIINFVLDKYPTNDDIIKYLEDIKADSDDYDQQDDIFSYEYEQELTDREERLLLPVEQNETYRKIRAYAIKNNLTTQLYRLLEYPHFDLTAVTQEVEDKLLRPALGSPLDYEYSQPELDELTKCLSWQE